MDFDPTAVRYEDLLQLFWTAHNPTAAAYSTQYASLVLAHDEHQLAVARSSRDRLEAVLSRPVLTKIELLDRFFPAEDYHQKYYLRNTPHVMREFSAMYGSDADFVASTAAARANGYVSGAGSCAQLDRERESLGLSEPALAHLRSHCD